MLRDLADTNGKKVRDLTVNKIRSDARKAFTAKRFWADAIKTVPGRLFMLAFRDVAFCDSQKTAYFNGPDYKSGVSILEKLPLYPLVIDKGRFVRIVPEAKAKHDDPVRLDSRIQLRIDVRPRYDQTASLEAWMPDDAGIPMRVLVELLSSPVTLLCPANGTRKDADMYPQPDYSCAEARNLWPDLVEIAQVSTYTYGTYVMVHRTKEDGRPS